MPRVVGIDAGTVSLDVCGLIDGRLSLDLTWPTADAIADPEGFIAGLSAAGEPDLVVAPSGYGLPVRPARDASDEDLRLAFLAGPDERGGIGGLRRLVRRLAASALPLVFTPGVVHLDTVPAHRKINRVDLGTADKVCATVLAMEEQRQRTGRRVEDISFILLELGGAFTAAVAVDRGRIVDGLGGTSGPIGWRASGALDGEVAFLAGTVTKALLFGGGVETVAGSSSGGRALAIAAYVEGAVKAVAQLRLSAPEADEVVVSGRGAADTELLQGLHTGLQGVAPVRRLEGFALVAKQGAQGAALLADGLAGGRHEALVTRLRIREAQGTVLDHLHVIPPAVARRTLGLDIRG
ncbi:MAG: DUF1464 family protein [Gemmatimonadales bacterium]|nr:DUF1464 family protein [Gemmatimonadales bacterium]